VKADLLKRYPNSGRLGRHCPPVEVILRMLVIKRLYNFSYEQTERFVNDSIVLRQFCRLYLESTPDDTTLIRWANVIGSQTVASLNERAVELARSLKVTRGRKLRVDGAVVETNIHHPTDSALLSDGVRVLSRLLRRAKKILSTEEIDRLGKDLFRTRNRSVRRTAQRLHRTKPGVRESKQKRNSKTLTRSSSPSPRQAVLRPLRSSKHCGSRPIRVPGAFSRSISSALCHWSNEGSPRRPAVSLTESIFRPRRNS
jgi:IS5 family transposase